MKGSDLFALVLVFTGGFMVWAGINNVQPIPAAKTFLQGGKFDKNTAPKIVPAANTSGAPTIQQGPLANPSPGTLST